MPGIDSYTKLCLHGNGADAATFIPDYGIPGVGTTPQTVLMLHFDGADAAVATKDAATDKAVTFVGAAQIDTAQSKFGGSSLLLANTGLNGDYITLLDSDDFNFGSGEFTIGFWARMALDPDSRTIFDQTVDANNYIWGAINDATHFYVLSLSGGTAVASKNFELPATMVKDVWYYFEICRSGNTLKCYLDGTASADTYDMTGKTMPDLAATWWVGSSSRERGMNGWIDDFFIIKGKSLHTANFTAPTISPSPKDVTCVANAQIDTAQKELGTGSILLDGTGDYLSLLNSADFNFGSGNFTVDFLWRTVDGSSAQFVMAHSGGSPNLEWDIYYSGTLLYFQYSTNGTSWNSLLVSWTASNNIWYHIAIVRNGNDLKFFIEGTQVGTTQDVTGVTLYSANAPLWIGGIYPDITAISCWYDEIRISKGIARWTSDFTPKTVEYDYNESSESPSISPSKSPSQSPSISPSASYSPSVSPSISPSASPSVSPSVSPSKSPSVSPSASYSPSISPSISPSASYSPSVSPSISPSISPSASYSPSKSPSSSPSISPSVSPSASYSPSISPSASPSKSPSISPSISPSTSYSPSVSPSVSPSASYSPSKSPSISPSVSPSASYSPSVSPSISPSLSPSASYSPSVSPSLSPSISPSASYSPSVSPSVSPSASYSPSKSPSISPSVSPSLSPSASYSPSISPSLSPSISPSKSPSLSPSVSPSASYSPSVSPSASPSESPSKSPSQSPSLSPSLSPSASYSPSLSPSVSPSVSPSLSPSASYSPSESPSISPSESPSVSPSLSPSISPSASYSPSVSPSVGTKDYSRGDYVVLPINDNDLETAYSAGEVSDVESYDTVVVGQTATGQYAIHQYRDFVGANTLCTLTWKGQSTLAPSSSIVVLQIYNYNEVDPDIRWKTVDSDNVEDANTDFILTANMADLTDYKKEDNTICCRIYQLSV